MPTVNFYLKKEPNPRLVFLQFKFSGQKFVYSTKQKIHEINWNPAKQRVKSNKETTKDGQYSLNDLLDNMEEVLSEAYKKELSNGFPRKEKLKEYLDKFFYKNLEEDEGKDEKTLFKLIDRFVAGEIKHKGRDKSS